MEKALFSGEREQGGTTTHPLLRWHAKRRNKDYKHTNTKVEQFHQWSMKYILVCMFRLQDKGIMMPLLLLVAHHQELLRWSAGSLSTSLLDHHYMWSDVISLPWWKEMVRWTLWWTMCRARHTSTDSWADIQGWSSATCNSVFFPEVVFFNPEKANVCKWTQFHTSHVSCDTQEGGKQQ